MRVLLLVAAVLLAACGRGANSTSTVEPPASSTAPAAERIADAKPLLEDSLLTISDVPAGWSSSAPHGIDGEGFCGILRVDLETAESANVLLQRSTAGPFVGENLGRYPAGHLDQVMSVLRNVPRDCPTVVEPMDNGRTEITWRVSAFSFPSFGDDAVAISMSSDVRSDVPAVVFVRYGEVLLTIVYSDAFTAGIDNGMVTGFVRKADKKLEPALSRLNNQ